MTAKILSFFYCASSSSISKEKCKQLDKLHTITLNICYNDKAK